MSNEEEFDLWEGMALMPSRLKERYLKEQEEKKAVLAKHDTTKVRLPKTALKNDDLSMAKIPSGFIAKLAYDGESNELAVYSLKDLEENNYFSSLVKLSHERLNTDVYKTVISLHPNAALVLRAILPGKTKMTDDAKVALISAIEKVKLPTAELAPTGKHIQITIPHLRHYREMMNKLGAYPLRTDEGSYRILLDRALDLEAMIEASQNIKGKSLPPITLNNDVIALNRQPIPGFDGSVESLKQIPISVLNVIAADIQSQKLKSKNDKNLTEKMKDMKVESLYDLFFYLPKRYIDKSKPQDIDDLIEGESATILGEVTSATTMANNGGARFNIKTDNGNSISVVFFRQVWLKDKFPTGSTVIVTGKYSPFKGQPSLGGSSIDHSDEAALLPIVPVYKQSESKGITTKLILSAAREMISRLGDFSLPSYLQKPERKIYSDILRELHFPTSLEAHKDAVGDLAYYELVWMQIQLIHERKNAVKLKGIKHDSTSSKFQKAAIKGLPWELTDSQKSAVKYLNERLEKDEPSSVLLNSDVGSGKTAIAQLAALKVVNSGYQAALAAPTEILARQLYTTFRKLIDGMGDAGKDIDMRLLVGGIPAKERNALKKDTKEGVVDILVGTHSVLLPTIKYKNLGFVAIDEQQKFGAEQRSAILNSREDGLVPDLLMQTATPIPRSTAQVFYGDMEMLELKGKPKGRKPIVTEWIEEDPNEIIFTPLHSMWLDIANEIEQGNQTFVVTPLVVDSPKVDAASVERTYQALKGIFGDKVGIVHGQMKPEEQRSEMEKFRSKEYLVLVASTVVEVGVDIPDATRVVILSADRFGASSAHQIRGRAGRNDKDSKCYLVSLGKTISSQIRMQAMVDFANGFDIAKVDLEVRGEGSLFGTSQSGASDMIFASLSKHSDKIPVAIEEAEEILSSYSAADALLDAKAMFDATGRLV